jgi:hypothetical protein
MTHQDDFTLPIEYLEQISEQEMFNLDLEQKP